jgi:hypothetical protein
MINLDLRARVIAAVRDVSHDWLTRGHLEPLSTKFVTCSRWRSPGVPRSTSRLTAQVRSRTSRAKHSLHWVALGQLVGRWGWRRRPESVNRPGSSMNLRRIVSSQSSSRLNFSLSTPTRASPARRISLAIRRFPYVTRRCSSSLWTLGDSYVPLESGE